MSSSTRECIVLKGIKRKGRIGTQEVMAGEETEYRSRI